MPFVLTQHTPRQDILLRRGVTEKIGVLWEEDAGTGFVPVDLSGWTVTFRIASPLGEIWAEIPAIGGVSGIASAELSASTFAGPEWAARGSGQWAMTAVMGDRAERLADGNYYLEV